MRLRGLPWAGPTVAFACVLFCGTAIAHPTQFTTLQVEIDSTGKYRGTLNIDILSYALGQTSQDTSNEELQALLDAPRTTLARDLADAGTRFQRELVIRTNVGDTVPLRWELPGLTEVNAVLARHLQPPILMPGEIDFSGCLPAGARTISVRLPYIMGDTVQVYELPDGNSHDEPVAAGGISTTIELGVTVAAEAASPRSSVGLWLWPVVGLAVAAFLLLRRVRPV